MLHLPWTRQGDAALAAPDRLTTVAVEADSPRLDALLSQFECICLPSRCSQNESRTPYRWADGRVEASVTESKGRRDAAPRLTIKIEMLTAIAQIGTNL